MGAAARNGGFAIGGRAGRERGRRLVALEGAAWLEEYVGSVDMLFD